MSTDVKAKSSYFTGRVGETGVQKIFYKNQIACNSLGQGDFGEDILCDIFSTSEDCSAYVRTKFSFRVQVKATKSIQKDGYIRRNKNGASISISVGLLQLWAQSYYPVVLVIWDESTDSGFWCFPIEQLNKLKNDQKTQSINFDYTNKFDDDGVACIKQKVEEYYSNIFKTDNTLFRCNIFPVWMPKFRMFTVCEVNDHFKTFKNGRYVNKYAHNLPSFLTSYNNCNYDGCIASFEYKTKSQPLSRFWDEFYKSLESIKFGLKGKDWVAFVVSPVEIVLDAEDRCVSNLTDWTCFSLIGGRVVSDFEYNFELSDKYTYSIKMRATSADEDFFLHSSGDFAVEVFAKGFSSHTRNSEFELRLAVINKSFCALDISDCSAEDLEGLKKWCDKTNACYVELNEDKNNIFITHPFFKIIGYDLLLPGVATWHDWDNLNFDSEKFLAKIPCGRVLDKTQKNKLFAKYHLDASATTEFFLLPYNQALRGEALVHNERIIRFIAYIGTINKKDCESYLKQSREQLKGIVNDFDLYIEPYEDITDIILEVKPPYDQSTREIVDSVETVFDDLVLALRKRSGRQANMAYYIKYELDRYIPESLVKDRK